MDLFWVIVIAFGFFIFGFLATLMAADNESDGLLHRAIVSGLLSSILYFLIIDIYDKL
tara:strand:+ start:506 stop:679 length:174 start_codon:yes stop_codon:yes gene_type:complete